MPQSVPQYGAGYLAECAGAGLPFSSVHPLGNPPLVMAKLSWAVPSGVPAQSIRLQKVTIRTEDPIFTCEVVTTSGIGLLIEDDFNDAVTVVIDGYFHGFVQARGAYFSYVIPQQLSPGQLTAWNTPEESTYELAPVCLEFEVGVVSLSVQDTLGVSTTIDSGLVSTVAGYNYVLTPDITDRTALTCSVVPGAGAGKEPCAETSTVTEDLRTINGQGPNEKGNILLQAAPADCITVDSRYIAGVGKIKLDAHCAPCCRCTDYAAVSDYIKGVAIVYHNMIRDLNNLITKYNSVATKFEALVANCSTAGILNPRFRIWPQPNFKLQMQAMVENNTDKHVRMQKLALTAQLVTAYTISATDPETGTYYQIFQGVGVSTAPLTDGSYTYFKNLNPTSKGISFSTTAAGAVAFEADLISPNLPTSGSDPNDVEPCTGYSMITGGLVIVDPIFRKIVSLAYPDGVDCIARLHFTYQGTAPGVDPCSNSTISQHNISPANGYDLLVNMRPNKSAVNPCDAVKASAITPTEAGIFKLKFPEPIYGEGTLDLAYYEMFEEQDGSTGWILVRNSTVDFTSTGATDIDLGVLGLGLNAVMHKLIVRYSGAVDGGTGGISTRCNTVGAVGAPVNIPASNFEVGVGFTP